MTIREGRIVRPGRGVSSGSGQWTGVGERGRGGAGGGSIRSASGGGESDNLSESGGDKIIFDPNTAHVLISEDKCGLIIGRGGSTIKEVGNLDHI